MKTQGNISKLAEKAVMLDDVREDGDTIAAMAARLERSRKGDMKPEDIQTHGAETDESGLRSDSIANDGRRCMTGYVEIPRVVR